jgi:hypothetical protein
MLTTQPERFPTGHEDLEFGATGEKLRGPVGRIYDLLEVVEEQQHVPARQLFRQRLERAFLTRCCQTDGSNNGLERRLRVPGGRQVHEVQAIFERVNVVRRCLEGQPCLSDSTRAGEREEPHAGRVEEIMNSAQFGIASEEL